MRRQHAWRRRWNPQREAVVIRIGGERQAYFSPSSILDKKITNIRRSSPPLPRLCLASPTERTANRARETETKANGSGVKFLTLDAEDDGVVPEKEAFREQCTTETELRDPLWAS